MPIYDYYCSVCDKKHEVLEISEEDKITECPVCGNKKIYKIIGNTSFRLKGNGWTKSVEVHTK